MSTTDKVGGADQATADPTLTREGVAHYAASKGIPAITPRLVKAETLRGRLAAFYIGNRVLYSPADVDAWLASRRKAATHRQGGVA